VLDVRWVESQSKWDSWWTIVKGRLLRVAQLFHGKDHVGQVTIESWCLDCYTL